MNGCRLLADSKITFSLCMKNIRWLYYILIGHSLAFEMFIFIYKQNKQNNKKKMHY